MDGRVQFGRQLRKLREEVGMLQRQVGEVVGYSESTVRHVEAGRRTPPVDLGAALDAFFRVPGRLMACLAEQVREDTSPFGELKEYEQQATRIRIWENRLVPGLLQTEAYARAVLQDENRVRDRMERQRVLDATGGPSVRVILDESVIYRKIGTCEEFKEQLRQLISRENRWTVQILPVTSGAHPGVGGVFWVLEFNDDAPVAYVEGYRVATLLDDANVVGQVRDDFDEVQGLALSPDISAEMIEAVIDDLPEGR